MGSTIRALEACRTPRATARSSTVCALASAAFAALAIALALPPGAARAGSPKPSIEAVWSFNGGEVAVHPGPAGTEVGTVVSLTKFAVCTHPVGEEMWAGMREQSDHSFWGVHQWYLGESEPCTRNQVLGPTAWRVMETSRHDRFLRVCFSAPGSSQPTIAPSGASAGVTYQCYQSALVAHLPTQVPPNSRAGAESFSQIVSLPSAKKCLSRRVIRVHLHNPKHDPLKEVVIRFGRHVVKHVRHGNVFAATVDLRGLPRGTFTIRIRASTVLGRHIAGKRTFHTCRRSIKPTSNHTGG